MLSGHSLLLVPDRYWERISWGRGWRFTGWAEVLCVVGKGSEPVLIRLERSRSEAHAAYHLSWDGEPLDAGSVVDSGTALEVHLPARSAARGRHQLRIRRVPGRGDGRDERGTRGSFSSVTMERAGTTVSLGAAPFGPPGYVADFLATDVTGLGTGRLGGCLFGGPGSVDVPVHLAEEGAVSFTVENASTSAARVELSGGGGVCDATVQAGDRAVVRLALQPGAHEVRLAAEVAGDGAVLWGDPSISGRSGPASPPVLLITLDTTRRDALEPYGAPAGSTPRLAELSRGATIYETAYATSPWTLPSHASILTGLYPSQHRAGVTSDRLEPRLVTLTDRLRRAGYRTAGFAGGYLASSRFGLGQGFGSYLDPERPETTAHQLTNAAVDFLGTVGEDPFFLFINYFDPHGPYRAPSPFRLATGAEELASRLRGLDVWPDVARGDREAWADLVAGDAPDSAVGRRFLKAAYAAEVRFVDLEIGRLLDELRNRRRLDDAVVVVVADHGELLGEGGYYSHSFRLDTELVWIPLMIKAPGQRDMFRVGDLVSQVDVPGAVLAMVRAAIEDERGEGTVLRPRADRREVFYEEHASRVHALNVRHMFVAKSLYGLQRRADREVVWRGGVECEVSREGRWLPTPCGIDWRESLRRIRGELVEEGSPSTQPAPEGAVDEDEAALLRALGYL